MWSLVKAWAKYNNPLCILLYYHQNLLVQIFISTVFVTFADSLFATFILLSHTITESSNTCAGILTVILFARMILFTLTLTFAIIPFKIWIACCTIESAFTIAWNIFYQCFSFIYSSYKIKYSSICMFCFGWNGFFEDTSSRAAQLSLHLFRLTING